MERIQEKFADRLPKKQKEIKDFLKAHGEEVDGEIKVRQLYQGQRGMPALICETSKLDPEEGIRFRGYSIPELQEKLPTYPGGEEPLPEGLFSLLLMDEMPTDDDVRRMSNNWARRAIVPRHVFEAIDALPSFSHPMTQFNVGIMALRTESAFAKRYAEGMPKSEYWEATYEDAMNLIARLPRVAAYIYRRMYHDGEHIEPDPKLDWAGNFAHMLGFDDPEFRELMRLYMTIHSDHEGGNVSAHAVHLVGSALGDAYQSFSAGMNGLAGPLHGLANQEVIKWTLEMLESIDSDMPTKEDIATYCQNTLDSGKVIPGFGHAVLRKTDPRYMAQREFAMKHMPEDPLFKVIAAVYEVVPAILQATGKVKNPWPNVDAHSGQLLMHYGLTQYDFYTVLFGVSRSLGTMANLIWDRSMGMVIERPGSTTTDLLKKRFNA